ncbi:hypothetical protein [Rhodococcus koreensis]|uniref:hypothetical protein n=1 Tax=Rhodococcus koreensis TaxID=99653 RepID=UPI0036DFA1BE
MAENTEGERKVDGAEYRYGSNGRLMHQELVAIADVIDSDFEVTLHRDIRV